jgi:DNA-binding transcriptional MerR regulator
MATLDPTPDERSWTVRELADEFGVTTRTLRFYEAEGLISPRREGTTRWYTQGERARLRLILRGRRLGMSLEESREIIDMYDGAESSERKQLQTLLDRLQDIAADLREKQWQLEEALTEVEKVRRQCRSRLSALKKAEL